MWQAALAAVAMLVSFGIGPWFLMTTFVLASEWDETQLLWAAKDIRSEQLKTMGLLDNVELNLQNCSGAGCTHWVDQKVAYTNHLLNLAKEVK